MDKEVKEYSIEKIYEIAKSYEEGLSEIIDWMAYNFRARNSLLAHLIATHFDGEIVLSEEYWEENIKGQGFKLRTFRNEDGDIVYKGIEVE